MTHYENKSRPDKERERNVKLDKSQDPLRRGPSKRLFLFTRNSYCLLVNLLITKANIIPWKERITSDIKPGVENKGMWQALCNGTNKDKAKNEKRIYKSIGIWITGELAECRYEILRNELKRFEDKTNHYFNKKSKNLQIFHELSFHFCFCFRLKI